MRALTASAYRQPLLVTDVAEPAAGAGDVLVEVAAAGLNHLDERLRRGEFTRVIPYPVPLRLGHDIAGTVVSVGSDVRGFAPEDEVFARVRDGRIGGFAERIAVDAADLAPKPSGMSMVTAASLPMVALTAWQALIERGGLRRGQRVLIHAGAGGVGSVAIQLAKYLGATVATTVSARDAAYARELGADVVIDYRTQDFAAELSDYDLVLDSLGGSNLRRSLEVLRPGGKVIGIAGPPDPAFARALGAGPVVTAAVALSSLSIRRAARTRGVTFEFLWMRADGEQLSSLAALIDTGVLTPRTPHVVDFAEIPDALAALGSRKTVGIIHPTAVPTNDEESHS